MVHGLEEKFSGQITFTRANIHNKDTFELQERLGFSVTPEFFLLDADGVVLAHWDETIDISQLEADLSNFVSR
jgi:hypothetical protein